jgi:ribosomal protein S18 acetylase RimI-like enzyme
MAVSKASNRERSTKAPPVYRPRESAHAGVQLKPAGSFRTETRPAPPAYHPQQSGASTPQQKPQAASVQAQSQYELSSPMWVGNGRQQIQVRVKGAPTPVGSVDVHYGQPGKAFISDLEVNQSHRRHGVATMLMKAAMESARRNGSSATELEARPGLGSISNQALVGMYQKLGFKQAGLTQRGNPKMSTR